MTIEIPDAKPGCSAITILDRALSSKGYATPWVADYLSVTPRGLRKARRRGAEPQAPVLQDTGPQDRLNHRVQKAEPQAPPGLGTVLVPSDSSPVSSSYPKSKRTPKNPEKRARKKTSSLVANPGHGLFVEEFFKLHEATTGARPLFTGKHGAMVNTVLKGLPVEQAVAKLKAYYGGDWWFTTKGGHSLEGFVGHINEIPLNGTAAKYSGTEEEMRERYQTVF